MSCSWFLGFRIDFFDGDESMRVRLRCGSELIVRFRGAILFFRVAGTVGRGVGTHVADGFAGGVFQIRQATAGTLDSAVAKDHADRHSGDGDEKNGECNEKDSHSVICRSRTCFSLARCCYVVLEAFAVG